MQGSARGAWRSGWLFQNIYTVLQRFVAFLSATGRSAVILFIVFCERSCYNTIVEEVYPTSEKANTKRS